MENKDYKNIKSIEDAFAAQNLPAKLPTASQFGKAFRKHVLLHYVIMVVTCAINGTWIPDFKNKKQNKYIVWLWIDETGVGFSLVDFGCTYSGATVGARLVFETAEQAIYAGELIKSTFEDYCLKY